MIVISAAARLIVLILRVVVLLGISCGRLGIYNFCGMEVLLHFIAEDSRKGEFVSGIMLKNDGV